MTAGPLCSVPQAQDHLGSPLPSQGTLPGRLPASRQNLKLNCRNHHLLNNHHQRSFQRKKNGSEVVETSGRPGNGEGAGFKSLMDEFLLL